MDISFNIDHIATLRNARGGFDPDPLRSLEVLRNIGSHCVTMHLREDRRHIKDADVVQFIQQSGEMKVNLELAPTEAMVQIALNLKPDFVCFVPEKREEVTTEGGLDVFRVSDLQDFIIRLQKNGTRVSLFIEPNRETIAECARLGAEIIELHTGCYANHYHDEAITPEILNNISDCINYGNSLGLEVHAGHGLNFENTPQIASIKGIERLHIGHFIIGEAVFLGLEGACKKMIQIVKNT